MGAFCSSNDDDGGQPHLDDPLLPQTKRKSKIAATLHRKAINELLLGWLIQKEEIEYKYEIGRGGFGAVHLAKYRNLDVAVKKMFPTPMEDFGMFDAESDDDDEQSAAATHPYSIVNKVTVKMLQQLEVGMMMRLRHPRIVAFLGAGELTEPMRGIFVVLEYVAGGDLTTRLRNARQDRDQEKKSGESTASMFTWKSRIQCACDIAEGMQYIHSKGMVHRDLKSMNVLCDAAGRAKIADLGLATSIEHYGSATRKMNGAKHRVKDATGWTGTSSWMAPEISLVDAKTRKATYGNAVDVYSFGVVMWEIMTKRLPWRDRDLRFDHEILNRVKEGRRPEATDKEMDESPLGWVELMWKCWAGDSTYRPCFSDIKNQLDDMLVRYSREIANVDETLLKKEMKLLSNEIDKLVKLKLFHEAARVHDKYLVVEGTMKEAKGARIKRGKIKTLKRNEPRHTIVPKKF
jgi:serine/threonine protein kinase